MKKQDKISMSDVFKNPMYRGKHVILAAEKVQPRLISGDYKRNIFTKSAGDTIFIL